MKPVLPYPDQICYNQANNLNITAGVVDHPPASRKSPVRSPAGGAERQTQRSNSPCQPPIKGADGAGECQ